MVVDDSYYKVLEVETDATAQQIKKAYRKLSLRYHPDKNPAPEAKEKFQAITEAYQVLSDDQLRSKYDKFGKESAVPEHGFEDASEYFAMIFGGEAFADYIGELTLLKDLTKTSEMSQEESATATTTNNDNSKVENSYSSIKQNLSIPDIEHSSLSQIEINKLKEKEEAERKKKQQEEVEKYEEEARKKREETRRELAEKLILKLSIWTESTKDKDCLRSFEEKYKAECDLLKLESFGLDILHTVGEVYISKATIFLKSQKFFGMGGFFSSIKEKAGVVSDTFKTISSALDAQSTMEEFAKLQEISQQSPNLDGSKSIETGLEPTLEEIAEMEKLLMGKVLAAAWHGSKFEIQSTIRGVCDLILYDEEVPLLKRIDRARALVMLGKVFKSTTRTDDENEEARVFEQLVAEAQKDKGKSQRRKLREEREKAAAAKAAINALKSDQEKEKEKSNHIIH